MEESIDYCEGVLGYGDGRYTLVCHPGQQECSFQAGDHFQVLIGVWWRMATMRSGGYRGWYLMLPDGQRVRPALCMSVRVLV